MPIEPTLPNKIEQSSLYHTVMTYLFQEGIIKTTFYTKENLKDNTKIDESVPSFLQYATHNGDGFKEAVNILLIRHFEAPFKTNLIVVRSKFLENADDLQQHDYIQFSISNKSLSTYLISSKNHLHENYGFIGHDLSNLTFSICFYIRLDFFLQTFSYLIESIEFNGKKAVLYLSSKDFFIPLTLFADDVACLVPNKAKHCKKLYGVTSCVS